MHFTFLKKAAVAICAALAVTLFAASALSQSPKSKYTVSFNLSDPPSARVEADVTIRDGLLMIGGSVNHLPRGWATFVNDLKVSAASGSPVTLEEFSDDRYKTRWRAANGFSGRAKLSYTVDLSLSKTKWEAGNEQAAFYDGSALFAATRLLFIVPDLETAADVEVKVPAGSRIAASWKQGAQGWYSATGEQLVNNTIVVGNFGGFKATEGNFEFTVALLGDAVKADQIVSASLKKYARAFTRIFDKTPRSAYMMTLFYADTEDGESYSNSAAFTTVPPITSDNMIMWANTLGHELFHFWCGQQISGEIYSESQWFQEGFTEYYANLAMMRENIMPERYFVWKMERTLGKYVYFRTVPQFEKVSLKAAGERKTTFRFGVYDGGWAAAFALDMSIREKTQGKRSLDDLMRLLYDEFGLTGRKFKVSDIAAAASRVAGSDLTDFFTRYVEGTELIKMQPLLAKVGFGVAIQPYANELLVLPLASTPLKQQWLSSQ